MQKCDNLVKPFIMCCADGYFIDCYGPFQANNNDAQIFRYILDTDEDLKILFTPEDKIIMFLDRGEFTIFILLIKGFRDNYWNLVDEGYSVQMPTCVQLERNKIQKKKIISNKDNDEGIKKQSKKQKALTTAQTGETRLVTKV